MTAVERYGGGMANLSPADVHGITFKKAPLGRRGYDEEHVDAFLDELERTLTTLYDQIARLGNAPSPDSASAVNPAAASELAEIKAALVRIEARLNAGGSPAPGGALF
jgi:DivIVA domain-containing protein